MDRNQRSSKMRGAPEPDFKKRQKKELEQRLAAFADTCSVKGKGPLSVVLTLTRNASHTSFPLSPDEFRTGKKGQVSGLGGPVIKSILGDYGIDRTLAEEGGRTSRGSMGLMENYIKFLNEVYKDALLDLNVVECWWIARVREFFASQPIRVKADISKSLRQIVQDLLDAARERQRECAGTTVVGTVLEHLVGAKLRVALPEINVPQKSASAADASTRAKGDFLIGDTAIHVTVAPAEALLRKCRSNLEEGLRPLVVTTEEGVGGIRALAVNEDIASRIDILEIGQFIAINVYEWIGFKNQDRSPSLETLIAVYNEIIDKCETDPSLKIALG